MDHFLYRSQEIHCEDVALSELAKKHGTPLYVYSAQAIGEACRAFLSAFSAYPTTVCYAVKANNNGTLLKTIFHEGLGADVVSQGELEMALRAGASPQKVVFSGVGKQSDEIQRAISLGIHSLNVESEAELVHIAAIAKAMGKTARISLRINPNIEVKTHPHIATGLYETKFGIAEDHLSNVLPLIRDSKTLSLVGIDCHIGSQILDVAPFAMAAERMAARAMEIRQAGFPLESIDLGGGIGIAYHDEPRPPIQAFADAILKAVKPTGLPLILEPGRSIVGRSGAIVTKVILNKQTPKKHFVVIDAAMNDLMRPALYDAFHPIHPVKENDANLVLQDVVGPVCETGDFLGLGRELPRLAEGDLLLVGCTGAYGMSMASNYNARPRAAEVLVEGKKVSVIRRRERFEDLVQSESGV